MAMLDPSKSPTLVHVLAQRAGEHPEKRVFTYVESGPGTLERELTYGALDRAARAVAARLVEAGASDEPVLLLYPAGLDFITAFVGCLYAGAIAVPAYPPAGTRGQGLSRLRAVASDCGARIVLSEASIARSLESWRESAPELVALHWIRTDELDRERGLAPVEPAPEQTAFLQYTSGSTAAPRGAVVTHANLTENLQCIREAFRGDPESDRGVFWLPQYHDMGLTGGLLLTCWSGSESTILSPTAFVKRPLVWLQTIARTRATISGGPNFAYDLCLRRIADQDLPGLDLSSWRVAFSGAEPVSADTCRRFAERFASCGFRPDAIQPGYGMAESTLIVTSRPPESRLRTVDLDPSALEEGRARIAREDSHRVRTIVSCGAPVPGQEVRIVDPESRRELPSRAVGEIWVRGPSVARGYWNRPKESKETFAAELASGERPFLRTGDLGFLHEGELFVTGRRKELLIFRGRNHYPVDIERTAIAADPDVTLAAAFAAGERLVLVCQSRHRRDLERRRHAIALAVASEHGLDVHDVVFVGPGQIPRTSSGKVQRGEVAARHAAGEIERFDARDAPSSTPAPPRRASSIPDLLVSEIAARCRRSPESIDVHAPLVSFGLGSVDAVQLTGRLEEHLGRELSPTLAYEYPTIDALARHLETGEEPFRGDGARPTGAPAGDDVAVVGIACRFPGAPDVKAFDALLRRGVDAVGPMPETRRTGGDDALFPEAGYLDEVDRFASEHFGIDASEAAAMDPQQRLLLELAWQALEDAGLPPRTLAGSATGVWVGISSADYALERFGDRRAHPHSHAAQAHSIAANRISYALDLDGPSIAVDTACSSSLVALHLACQSMRAGECDVALVGGVNVLLSRSISEQFQRGGYMSASGRCRSFDAGADGYVRGEGAAVVVLKRLGRAVADRDRVYAVVRATACNQDGRTNGLTAPSRQAQEALLRRAYAEAGVDPRNVALIEAHGTGTPLGDPIEARALGAVVGRERAADNPCRLASVKSNVGHLEAAAGIAGFVKTALSLHTRTLYPSCHFENPNPNVNLEALGLRVQSDSEPWPEGSELLAGVSSFGFGGTNAHAVLAAAPHESAGEEDGDDLVLLPVSAPTAAELQTHASAMADALEESNVSLRDAVFTLGARRTQHAHRRAVVARGRRELAGKLREPANRAPFPVRPRADRGPIAFTFGGQGGQWLGMASDLLSEQPVFRAAFDRLAAAVVREGGGSPADAIGDPSELERIDRVQPALFAVGVALSDLLRAWGVEPDLMIGQSMGEITAATAAGALSIEDGAAAIVRRSALMARLAGSGTMALVDLPAESARERLARFDVSIAVHASPTTSVVAGHDDAVRSACRTLEADGIGVRPIQVDVASHSPLVEPLRAPLAAELSSVGGRAGEVPLLSSVTAEPLEGAEIDAGYLWRNLREPVRFAETVEAALARGVRAFVEIGPHPVLSVSTSECLRAAGLDEAVALSTLRRKESGTEALLETLGALYERGHDPRFAAIAAGGRVVDLPQPRLPRRRHWSEPVAHRASRGSAVHPLLDGEVRSAAATEDRVFEVVLSEAAFPELTQHRIAGAPVLSAGALFEVSRAAVAAAVSGERSVVLRDVVFERPLQVPSDPRQVQIVVRAETSSFAVYSLAGDRRWLRHARGSYDVDDAPPPEPVSPAPGSGRVIEPSELYGALSERGLAYGPPCQRVAELRRDDDACTARVDPHDDLQEEGYRIHPLLLDMCLQSLAPLVDEGDAAALGRAREVRLLRRPDGAVEARAVRNGNGFDLTVTDRRGVVASGSGLELVATRGRLLREPSVWRKRIRWSKVPLRDLRSATGRWTVLGQGPLAEALAARETAACGIHPLPQSPADAERLAGEIDRSGIVLCFENDEALGLATFVRLAQRSKAPLWIVTRGASHVLDEDVARPMQAAVAAAARAAWSEGALEGGTIDLGADGDSQACVEAELIWREIGSAARKGSLVAFRRGERLVPRLEPAREAPSAEKLAIDANATYLVTGGLGDLGLHAARWLVRRGARRLVLCGRSAPEAASVRSRAEAIAELESEGASVVYRTLDVTDVQAVSKLASELPAVSGIVHAAGSVELCPFPELGETAIATTFAPKAIGAENLRASFDGPDLKLFLLYVSSAAWLGALSRGLAHYAAANAYLEAFATRSRRDGAPAIAIAWPPWQDIGRVRDAAAAGHFAELGVATIAPEEADEVLDSLDAPVTLLSAIDRPHYACRGADVALLGDLDDGPVTRRPSGRANVPYEPPRGALEARLAEAWQEVLGVERVGRSDHFFSLGGNSIKAATLLNRLKRHMREPISIVALFEAPTIAHLADYLRAHHADCAASIESAGPSQPSITASPRPAELLARIDELSPEEVDALIEERRGSLAR